MCRGVCATSTVKFGHDEVPGHDEFGNITSQTAQAAGSNRKRRTETFYLHDHTRWLQALPRLSRTVDPADPDRLLRATLTCYDKDTLPDCDHLPANARGLATLTRQWDNTRGGFVVTGQAGYDEFGNQTTSTDGRDNTTTTTFDPQLHLHPIKVCNAHKPEPHCTQQPEPWDRRVDAPLLVIDPNNAQTRHSYDPLGRPQTTTRPSGAVDTFSYQTDATSGTLTTDTTTAPGVHLWARSFADGLGRTYLVERPGDDGDRVVQVATRYSDGSQRPYQRARPAFKGEEQEPVWETMEYDAAGRLTRQVHGDKKPDKEPTEISRRYLVRDDLVEVQDRDETDRTQTHLYDGWGALVRTEQPSIIPGRLAVTRYNYDAVGDQTAITDPAGNTIRRKYDTLGRMRVEDDPDRGTTRYRYDLAGNLKRKQDARGRVLEYDYDELNRPIHKHDLAAKTTSSWVYDEPGHGAGRIGRLTSVHDPSAAGCPDDQTSRSLSYDLSGNLTGETRCVGGTAVTFTSHPDRLGRLDTLTYPDGEQLTYKYDRAGHLASVSGYVEELGGYNAEDQLGFARYANHTRARWHYSPSRGWLEDQTLVSPAGRPLFDSHYGHYPNGLVESAGSASNHTDEHYDYDDLGRLTSVTGSTWQQQLGYDDLGNLTSNSRVGTYHYRRGPAAPARAASDAAPAPTPSPRLAASATTTTPPET